MKHHFDPAATQEAAAGLPFSTYRRYLAVAIERLAEWLRPREIAGPGEEPSPEGSDLGSH